MNTQAFEFDCCVLLVSMERHDPVQAETCTHQCRELSGFQSVSAKRGVGVGMSYDRE